MEPSPATLALLLACYPDCAQGEIISRWHTAARLLERHLSVEACGRLNPNMRGALVSFCMDLGFAFFAQSTLRHRVNAGRYVEAVAQFLPCHNRNGKVDKAMRQRRAAEASLFCSFPA